MASQSEEHGMDESDVSATPRIVNGMPRRPRKPVNVWKILGLAGVSVASDLLLLASIPFVVQGIFKYLEAKLGPLNRPDACK